MTWSRSKPISMISRTVFSYFSPVTSVLSGDATSVPAGVLDSVVAAAGVDSEAAVVPLALSFFSSSVSIFSSVFSSGLASAGGAGVGVAAGAGTGAAAAGASTLAAAAAGLLSAGFSFG